ncbi:MAG: phosphotransferase [Ilumatobacter sp.]|nr:phosphotransferase [Ilumatobacter sp.]
MTTSPRHRDVHLVLPDAAHEQVVVTDGGALPRRRVQLAAGESTAQAVRRDLMADADLPDVAILDLLFDEREFDLNDDGRPLRALALLGPAPAGWAPPAGWRWRRAEEAMGGSSADPVTGPPTWLASLQQWAAEWAGAEEVPAARAAWARPAWWADMTAWIHRQLATAGRHATGPVEQVRHWGISAVLRVPTDGGPVWVKEVFPVFAYEPAITALVAHRVPRTAPAVLAAEGTRLMMAEVEGGLYAAHPEDTAVPYAALHDLQAVVSVDEALAAGVPDRRFTSLAADLHAALVHPVVAEVLRCTPADADRLAERIAAAAAGLADLPDVLVHGDFHPGNVIDGPVILDWSDAAVSNPLVDAAVWDRWLDDGTAWRQLAGTWGMADTGAGRAAVQAYHLVSYARIVTALEPAHRFQQLDGLREHHRMMVEALR